VIVVAGGTGRLGSLVVKDLVGRGHRVRVLTRDPARAAALVGPLVDVVQADIRLGADVARACADAAIVVSAVHGVAGPGHVSPESVDRDGNGHLFDAARVVGADVVLTSIVDARPDHPVGLFRMKAAAEASLQASGLASTIVRPSAFGELYVELFRDTARRMRRPLVLGRGDNPVNFVAVEDVAHVVVEAVVDRSLRGQILEVAGPANLTLGELAVHALPGSRPRHVPRGLLRVGSRLPGQPGRLAGLALAMDTLPMAVPPDRVRRPKGLPVTPITELIGRTLPQR
jgi:uncharacterized protein YbjT (DUF2867 family)